MKLARAEGSARCPFLPFYPYAECAPESRRRFLASGNAIRGPDGIFWRQEMQSGVPTAFFGVRKCNPESRRHFLASGNAIRGPDGIFWRQEMQSRVPPAISGVSERQKMSMGKGFSKNKNSLTLRAALHSPAPFDRLGGGFDIYFQLCGPVKAHGSFVSKASSVPPSRQ